MNISFFIYINVSTAYKVLIKFLINLLKKYYHDIIKLSILDYIDNSEDSDTESQEDIIEQVVEKKIVKIKKIK